MQVHILLTKLNESAHYVHTELLIQAVHPLGQSLQSDDKLLK